MMKIGTKLGVGIGTLLALCIVIGLVSYTQTQVVREKLEEVTRVKEPTNSAIYELENNLVETAFATLGYFATGDQKLSEALTRTRDSFEHNRERYEEAIATGNQPGIQDSVRALFVRLFQMGAEQIRLRDQSAAQMRELLNDLNAIDRLLTERITKSISVDDPLAYKRLQAALEMQVQVNAIMKGIGSYLLTGESQYVTQFLEAEREFRRFFQVYQIVLISSQEKAWSAELRQRFSQSLEIAGNIVALQKQRTGHLNAFVAVYRELASVIGSRLKVQTTQNLASAKEDLLATGQAANSRILGVLTLSVLFGVIAGVATTRQITRPLLHLVSVMNAVAKGDRLKKVELSSSDEFRLLGDSFNQMTGQLVRANEELRMEIAERKRMEEGVRESELRFRSIFEGAPIGIALTDREGKVLQLNPVLEEMIERSAFESRGKSLDALLGTAALFSGSGNEHVSRHQQDVTYRRKDGRAAWCHVNVSRVEGEHGDRRYNVVMLEDTTARRATEQQMRMLAHTLRSMNESVIITDASNSILLVNPAFSRTYGYREADIVGKHVGILHDDSALAPPSEEPFSMNRSTGWTGELEHVRSTGERFPVLLSTSLVRDESGMPIALVGISRDITEQRRLQRKLAEAEHERLESVRAFAASVQRAQEDERRRISRELHDDLCQRLSGMKFRVEVLEDDVRPLNKRVTKQLRDFTQELERSIVEVRRISSNLRPSVIDDFGLVTALRLLAKDFEARNKIATALDVRADVPTHCDGDVEIALYRIAQEALANVARYANASVVTLELETQGTVLTMRVRDNGKGFVPDDVAAARAAGHGMGLISMRERTELLGGSFGVQSAINAGTTLTTTLPIRAKNPHGEDENTHR
jgi:PAS domain S-box-containing protein